MAFDEPNWGNSSPRKSQSKPNYSPSASYNYSPNGNYQSQSPSARRRPDRNNKRHNNNNNNNNNNNQTEKLIKQNDLIIRLLKEIRDRLPENGQISEVMESQQSDQDQYIDMDEQLDTQE